DRCNDYPGDGEAVFVDGQSDTVFCPQGHARAGTTASCGEHSNLNDSDWPSQSLNPGIGITQSRSNGFRQPCEDQNTDGRIRAGALVEPAAREHVKIGIPFGVNVGRSYFIIDESQFPEKTALAHGCQMAVVSCNGQQDSNATPPDKKHLVAGITGRKESLFPL